MKQISTRIRHVEFKAGNVKKQHLPPSTVPFHHKPVYTASKVLMAGFTIRGIESEISYTQGEWILVAVKELGDNAYDFFKEFYPNSPKEHRKISYHVWCPYPDNCSIAEYFMIRIEVTSSNVDNIPVFEDLPLVFDLNRYCSSKRSQYKGGTGELGDALKRMLKMGYASWTSHHLNEGKPNLQEIDEAKVIINRDYNAVINNTDTTVSVALPMVYDYEDALHYLRQYYNIYKVPKIRTEFSFVADPILAASGQGSGQVYS